MRRLALKSAAGSCPADALPGVVRAAVSCHPASAFRASGPRRIAIAWDAASRISALRRGERAARRAGVDAIELPVAWA